MEKFFKLQENNTNVRTEVIAGFTTFVTMAYIIFVNPNILKMGGMNSIGAIFDGAAGQTVFNDPIVGAVMAATCLAAAIGSFIMGFYANYPFAQAPGMGLNATFAFTVMVGMAYSWQAALAAVFISGIIFIIITLTGLRESIVNAIPLSLKHATGAGIGLFIALIGLKNAGIVAGNPATIIGLGDLSHPQTILAIVGIVITAVLMARGIKGAMLIGILITTVIGIPMGVVSVPAGFSPVSMPPSIAPTLFKLNFSEIFADTTNITGAVLSFLSIVIAFTFVDMFDTLGTLIGTGAKAGFLDKEGKLPRINKAMMADAVATSAGALLGTSTTTTYVESAAGVAEGGRTGLTAVTVGVLFLAALFLAPVAGLVPAAATAPALIIVGVLMMSSVKEVDFSDFTEALPAFFTIVMMPFAFSIADGIAMGLITYPIVKVAAGRSNEVKPLVYILAILFILRYAFLRG